MRYLLGIGLIVGALLWNYTKEKEAESSDLIGLPEVIAESVLVTTSTSTPTPVTPVTEDCNICKNSGCVGDGVIFNDCGDCERTCSRDKIEEEVSPAPIKKKVEVSPEGKKKVSNSYYYKSRRRNVYSKQRPGLRFKR